MRKKDINNFKKLFNESVLFRYIVYLVVILLIWGILQIVSPNSSTNTTNTDTNININDYYIFKNTLK